MKKLIGLLLFLSTSAFAAAPTSYVPTTSFEYELTRLLGAVGLKYTLGTVLRQSHTTAIGTYDFAAQGGAIGSFFLGVDLPAKAIIKTVLIDTVTAPTSGGSATISLGAVTTTDLKAATAIATYTGIIAAIPVGTAATAVKCAAACRLKATVAVAALTAGKIKYIVDYAVSE